MLLLTFAIILSVIVAILCGFTRDNYHLKFKPSKKMLLGLLPMLLISINFFTVVPANNVGIQYSPFSGVMENTLDEGFQSKGFFDKVYMISTEVQSKLLKDISGQTKDSQYITMDIDVKYKVDINKAYEVFRQYRELSNVSENLISPTVQRSVESISTEYNIMEILGNKRNDIYIGIEKQLTDRFASNGITFISINFIDTDAGDAIEQAIKNEAIAKKQVETAEQERQKAEIEAQKRVVEAEANKQKAEIEAQTKIIEATADAQANRLLSESITEALLKKMEMEARLKHGWITVEGGMVITDATGKATTPAN